MKKTMFACSLALCAALPAVAADNPWVGTWKLDPAKSHFTGDTFTMSKGTDGKMHYSDGSTTAYDFGLDGKEYPMIDDRMVAWTSSGDRDWDDTIKAKGTELVKNHYTLSADGKTLSIVSKGTKPDGSKFNDDSTYTRVTGTKGLAGKWRSTKVNISAPDQFIVSAKSGGIFHWDIPGYKESIEGKMDGSDLAITGPTVAPAMTVALKLPTPRSIHYTVKDKGKVVGYGIQTLAADGKSFTDVSWNPGKMSEKTTGYYARE